MLFYLLCFKQYGTSIGNNSSNSANVPLNNLQTTSKNLQVRKATKALTVLSYFQPSTIPHT